MIDELMGERVERFWNAYPAAARLGIKAFGILKLGDSADLADELAAQVVTGKKRAMTSLLRNVGDPGGHVPKPGDFSVVVDGKNAPRCIVRIRQVEIKPLREVDESFAWDEGGGDRSLKWWRSAHARYFKRQAARDGFSVDEDTVVVLERFEVVWPIALADPP